MWNHADVSTATLVPAATPKLTTLEGDGHAYVLVAPVLASGWAFLGEPDKLTPVSAQRAFTLSVAAAGGVSVRMVGAPGEKCALAAWRAGKVYDVSVTVGADGSGTAIFSV